jgi:beta-glucosidase
MDIITGKAIPSGKLAESYPINYCDSPSASNFHNNKLTVEYREGIFIGYRYFDTASVPVCYPFGFGLSYTTFKYSDIKVNNEGVTFTLENTGQMAGAEIAQLYIGMPDSMIFRPKKELKGFKKVYLESGEKKTVFIPFDDKSFRYYSVKTCRWEIEEGQYDIMVGASSVDIKLYATLRYEGTTCELQYEPKKLPSYYSGHTANVISEEFEALIGRPVPFATCIMDKKKSYRDKF